MVVLSYEQIPFLFNLCKAKIIRTPFARIAGGWMLEMITASMAMNGNALSKLFLAVK
jgi:hypothetical protein